LQNTELLGRNRRFYDSLWSESRLIHPQRFNTWSLVQSLLHEPQRRLEVAPGMRPRLPLHGTQFADISLPALRALRPHAAGTAQCEISALPFAADSFELVCALDIIEHVEDDEAALSELCRVACDGAVVLLSTPLFAARWTPFDDFVGHRRRYEPDDLRALMGRHGLHIEQSAAFGMQPKSSRFTNAGMWWLVHNRDRAMWWYNRVLMPLGVRFQKKLEWHPGLMSMASVDELIVVCRKKRRA
jgi:SAM-dependent methyltransferase